MSGLLTNYIITYGYLAIFGIVLLQELGMPGLPNELVLLYFGYLGRQAGLSYPLVICLVVTADITGSFILYFLFYYGRSWLVRIKPSWIKTIVDPSRPRLPISRNTSRSNFSWRWASVTRGNNFS